MYPRARSETQRAPLGSTSPPLASGAMYEPLGSVKPPARSTATRDPSGRIKPPAPSLAIRLVPVTAPPAEGVTDVPGSWRIGAAHPVTESNRASAIQPRDMVDAFSYAGFILEPRSGKSRN